MWSVYLRNLLVRIHNSPAIWAHQPSLDTKHWTVGKQNTDHAQRKPQPCKYFLQNSVTNTAKLVLPFQQHDHLNNTHTQKKGIRIKLGSVTSTACGVMLHSPILWPIMENLSHCRAEGANFTDHQPSSEFYHTYRHCFYLKWITSLACFQCSKKNKKCTTEFECGWNHLHKYCILIGTILTKWFPKYKIIKKKIKSFQFMALRTINDSAHIHHVIRKRVQHSRRTMWWQTVTWQVYCHISALWKENNQKCDLASVKWFN